MRNKSRFIVASLGVATIAIAPIAAVVSCNEKTKKVMSSGLPTTAPIKTAPVVSPTTNSLPSQTASTLATTPVIPPAPWTSKADNYTNKLTQVADKITSIDANGSIIKKVDVNTITPYSVNTLSTEALGIYNNKPGAVWAGWRGSPLMASVYTMFSLVKALANEYGYDTEVNGTSPRDEFLKNQYMNVITDEKSIDENQTDEIKNQMKFLASLKQDNIQNVVHLPFSIGETEQTDKMKDVFNLAHINFSTYPDTYLNDENMLASNLQINNFSIWDDEKNPGETIMSIYTQTGLYHEITLQNVKDKYAVIEKSKFESEYIPYIKSALIGFVNYLKANNSMFTLLPKGGFDPMMIDQIIYLLNQNTDSNGVFKFDDATLQKALSTLNNGSLNWLAIKALEYGFDNSITSNEYSILTNNDSLAGKINYGDSIKGINSWDSFDLIRWLAWLDSDGNFLNDDQSLFNATDIIDSNYLKGKIDDSKIDRIESYIKSKP